jgi:ribosomal protein S18 acetylase RimI-like enzyme
VSLAIRADNDAARRLYLGLGFEVRAELETLRRERPGRADA